MQEQASKQPADTQHHFLGFVTPNYTPIPDQLFDELLPILTGNETKVLLYICRRTFGFKKGEDNISLGQMVSGITTRDGQKLDGGTGLSKASVARALKDLEDKNIIIRERRFSEKTGDLPTTYRLNVINPLELISRREGGSHNFDTPRVSHRDTPLSHHDTPRVSHRDTQETAIQQTVLQETENTTTKQTKSLNDETVVVADMVSFGISTRVSENLCRRFSPDYIGEKIEFLRFKLDRETDSVKKPAAWLRKAIEDDYSAPDGYLSPNDREMQQSDEKRRKQAALESQREHLNRIEQLQNEQQLQKSQTLAKIFERFGTGQHEFEQWSRVQPELINANVPATVVGSLQLVRLTHEEATLCVANQFMWERVTAPDIKKQVEKVFVKILGKELRINYVIAESENETETKG